MARSFVKAAYGDSSFYDIETCAELGEKLIESPDSAILVNEAASAMIGVCAVNLWFNKNLKVAQELFWWADKGAKSAFDLVNAAEDWARQIGVSGLYMSSLHGLRHRALGRVFESRGYKLRERAYFLEFDGWQ
ncbi:MAG: hypothetical protein AAF607_10130 [Pseudomonadota bacterium]